MKKKNLPDLTIRWRKDGKFFRETNFNKQQQQQHSSTTTINPSEFDSLTGGETTTGGLMRDEPRIFVVGKNGSLVFTTVGTSDAGEYDCQLMSSGKEIATSNKSEFRVVETLKFAPQPTSKTLELGSVGKVHCKAHGTPSPVIKWIQVSVLHE